MYYTVYNEIREALAVCTGSEEADLTDAGEHADLASTVAFRLAKVRKMAPVRIAAELAEELRPILESRDVFVEATGPYINFRFGMSYVQGAVRAALAPGFGALPVKTERVCIEHTSANPNGPLHVGHIRNSIIGDSLARAFRKAGYPLEVEYYINDMGRQIAIVSWGFSHLGIDRRENEKADHYVARVYIAANRALEADPSIKEEIERRMALIERGDPEMVIAFRKVVDLCVGGIRETLARLNVTHDRFVRENDFVRNHHMQGVIGRLKLLPEAQNDGTLSLDLSAFGFEKEYVIRRSDGTSVYAARDLAYHEWKAHNFDVVIDVLGADHKLIGAQLQATLPLLGVLPPEIVHFEFVSLPEGSMSTRAGTFVSADELIDEVTARAFDEVTVRRPELPEDERRDIARSVAVGAIRYDIIRVSPEKSTVFDWKEALNFERQSAPYIQYAHARASSILEKAGGYEEAFSFATDHEIRLAKQIARFPRVIELVVTERRPHLLSIYARELADLFNTFYRYDPVLKSEGETRNSRLTLVRAAQNTLKEALETLGIDALGSM
ncbi:MAG: arginine--tRNA ligase [Methanomicrobiaceae archaeon]|nr:arginine--tRNA ligase [Methanomicrobiaceae archaeon]